MAYIDEDALICFKKQLCELEKQSDKFSRVKAKFLKKYIIPTLEHFITADVVEVKHSQWVVEAYDNQDNIVVIPYIEHQHCEPFCLICGKRALLNGAEDYVTSNYCPNCGAKMDLVGN